jgi:hypothetical protein
VTLPKGSPFVAALPVDLRGKATGEEALEITEGAFRYEASPRHPATFLLKTK